VQSLISYTLTDNTENLVLTGTDALNGTGNSLNNTLMGNNGNNYLLGGAGNDTLQGKGGADTIDGGTGSDTYYYNNSDGQDTINNYDTSINHTDILRLTNIAFDDLKFSRNSNDLTLVVGDENQIVIRDFYVSGDVSTRPH
jgi:Ca2+-binding RTX toxin-like protein